MIILGRTYVPEAGKIPVPPAYIAPPYLYARPFYKTD